ncbi:MAG: glycosyltransferase, partial [Pseudomonadota bacterium]
MATVSAKGPEPPGTTRPVQGPHSVEDCNFALVHHWLLNMAGGERVCEALCELLPIERIYTLFAEPDKLTPTLRSRRITTGFLQKIPLATKYHRLFVAAFPLAVESFDLREYDIVISSDAGTAKGVLTLPETFHVCYCHSPIRYAWNMTHEYSEGYGPITKAALSLIMHYLRLWDFSASARVDHFIANSGAVRNRIIKYYRRNADVIYPPCNVEGMVPAEGCGEYYLCAGRLVGYKRFDLAVEAFNRNGLPLLVVGDGPELNKLKAIAKKNVDFVGWVSAEELASIYRGCRALVFPGEEDFGIVPVEVQACGRPVLALGKGGALESVISERTGLFFFRQTPE